MKDNEPKNVGGGNGVGANAGGAGGDRELDPDDDPTKVESGPSAEGDTVARARTDARLFDRLASPLDAIATVCVSLPDDLQRLAPARRLRAIELIILKMRQTAETCFETAHVLTELHRALAAQKDTET